MDYIIEMQLLREKTEKEITDEIKRGEYRGHSHLYNLAVRNSDTGKLVGLMGEEGFSNVDEEHIQKIAEKYAMRKKERPQTIRVRDLSDGFAVMKSLDKKYDFKPSLAVSQAVEQTNAVEATSEKVEKNTQVGQQLPPDNYYLHQIFGSEEPKQEQEQKQEPKQVPPDNYYLQQIFGNQVEQVQERSNVKQTKEPELKLPPPLPVVDVNLTWKGNKWVIEAKQKVEHKIPTEQVAKANVAMPMDVEKAPAKPPKIFNEARKQAIEQPGLTEAQQNFYKTPMEIYEQEKPKTYLEEIGEVMKNVPKASEATNKDVQNILGSLRSIRAKYYGSVQEQEKTRQAEKQKQPVEKVAVPAHIQKRLDAYADKYDRRLSKRLSKIEQGLESLLEKASVEEKGIKLPDQHDGYIEKTRFDNLLTPEAAARLMVANVDNQASVQLNPLELHLDITKSVERATNSMLTHYLPPKEQFVHNRGATQDHIQDMAQNGIKPIEFDLPRDFFMNTRNRETRLAFFQGNNMTTGEYMLKYEQASREGFDQKKGIVIVDAFAHGQVKNAMDCAWREMNNTHKQELANAGDDLPFIQKKHKFETALFDWHEENWREEMTKPAAEWSSSVKESRANVHKLYEDYQTENFKRMPTVKKMFENAKSLTKSVAKSVEQVATKAAKTGIQNLQEGMEKIQDKFKIQKPEPKSVPTEADVKKKVAVLRKSK